MNKRIALVGAGSLGTILGAYVSKAGYDIVLVDNYEEHVEALNKYGATVKGTVEFNTPVKAMLPDRMSGVYDVILFMVKQTYNEKSIDEIKNHIDDNTAICTLQNGIPELVLVEKFGSNRIYGAPVGWGATFDSPGVSILTTDKSGLSFTLGSFEGKIDDRLKDIKLILESMGRVQVSENLMGLRFTKLLMNATFSGLSTALGTTFGGVLDNDEAMGYIAEIGKECIQVAKANNIKLEPYEGWDFNEVFCFNDMEGKKSCIKQAREIWKIHYNLTASMMQDLLKGKSCEINAINGVVCNYGDKSGIETPFNDMVVNIVTKIMNKELSLDFDNIKYFRNLNK